MDTIAYIRVSTEQQAGEDRTSLTEQRRAIVEMAASLGRVIPPEGFFTDPRVSGATAEGRPGFMAVLGYCEANPRPSRDGRVLVLNDSRFGRFKDMREAQHWQFVLSRMGWDVRFCEGDEIQDGLARNVMRLVGSAQATEYRENLRRTQRRASRAIAEMGRWRCEAPLGYRRLATRNDGAQRLLEIGQRKADDEIVRLALGPIAEQELVRWLFETYASGSASLWHLALAAEGRAPGLRSWKTQVVRNMLANPAYVGDVVHGRRPMSDDGSQRIDRDESNWLVVANTHPAIISRELFESVQKIMSEHHARGRASNGSYTLTGLLRCSCGQNYQGGGGNRGPSNDPGRWLFYRCAGANQQVGTCRPPLVCVNQRWIESLVIETVSDVVTSPETIDAIHEAAYRIARSGRSGSPKRRDALARERDGLLRQRKRIVDSIARETLAETEAASSLSEIRARIVSLEAEIERLASSQRSLASLELQAETIIADAFEFPAIARDASPAVLRNLLSFWIDRLVVTKETRAVTISVQRIPGVIGTMDMEHSPEQD